MSQGPAPSSPSATIRNLRSPGSRRPPNRLGKVLSLSINYQLRKNGWVDIIIIIIISLLEFSSLNII